MNIPEKFLPLFQPTKIYTAHEVKMGGALPSGPGIYGAWFKDDFANTIPQTEPRHKLPGWQLLYIGKANHLNERLNKNHLGKSSRTSTFRRSVIAVASGQIGINFEQIYDSKRIKRIKGSSEDEKKLTEWLLKTVIFSILEHNNPKFIEVEAVSIGNVALNSEHNRIHSFYRTLYLLRNPN